MEGGGFGDEIMRRVRGRCFGCRIARCEKKGRGAVVSR